MTQGDTCRFRLWAPSLDPHVNLLLLYPAFSPLLAFRPESLAPRHRAQEFDDETTATPTAFDKGPSGARLAFPFERHVRFVRAWGRSHLRAPVSTGAPIDIHRGRCAVRTRT